MASKFFQSQIVMSDGTFYVAPKGYHQVYILWVVKTEEPPEEIPRFKAFPALFFILKSKSQAEYEQCFKAIQRYICELV